MPIYKQKLIKSYIKKSIFLKIKMVFKMLLLELLKLIYKCIMMKNENIEITVTNRNELLLH